MGGWLGVAEFVTRPGLRRGRVAPRTFTGQTTVAPWEAEISGWSKLLDPTCPFQFGSKSFRPSFARGVIPVFAELVPARGSPRYHACAGRSLTGQVGCVEAPQTPHTVRPKVAAASQLAVIFNRWMRGSPTKLAGDVIRRDDSFAATTPIGSSGCVEAPRARHAVRPKRDDSFTARRVPDQAGAWKPHGIRGRCDQRRREFRSLSRVCDRL